MFNINIKIMNKQNNRNKVLIEQRIPEKKAGLHSNPPGKQKNEDPRPDKGKK
jgi:hypothetical protein